MTHFDNSNLLRVIYRCPVCCISKFRTRRTFRICDIGVRKLNTAWVKNIRLTIDKIVNTAALFLISVKVKVSSVNEETGETVFTEKAVLTEQPCRLSFQSRNSAAKDDGYSTISQSVVLFIAPEVEIPSGSKITVTQNGKTTDYCRSGESAVYTSHQEIALELFEDYA